MSVDFAELPRDARVAELRARMAAVTVRGREEPPPLIHTPVPVLPAPHAFASLLPGGGLAKGSTVFYSGANSLLIGMIAAATAGDAFVTVVGKPRLGLLAAAEMGCDFSKLALVSDPGQAAVDVAAVLLDGVDLVVLDLGGETVTPTRSRAVVARTRSKKSVLLVTGGGWTGADLRLESRVVGYQGLGQGSGRVRSVMLDARAQGKGFTHSAQFTLAGSFGRTDWSESTAAPTAGNRTATGYLQALTDVG